MRPIVTLLLLVMLISGCSKPVEESFKHGIEYSISLEFGKPAGIRREIPDVNFVENVTLIVPFPFRNGTPMNVSLLSLPEGWNASLIETDYGTMLLLRADGLETWRMEKVPVPVEPGSRETPEIPEEKRPASYEFRIRLEPDREVNTLDPLGGEYLLQPKLDLREVECGDDARLYRFARCYSYLAPVYFSSEPFVDAGVVVWLGGDNWWFTYGWTGNEFDDSLFASFEKPGWKFANGSLKAGYGVYRR
ncbi:hypothetical protein [Geoglobus sp.]